MKLGDILNAIAAPINDIGPDGYVLTANSSSPSGISWSPSAGGGGSASGPNGSVQLSDGSGNFVSDTGLTFSGGLLSVSSAISSLDVLTGPSSSLTIRSGNSPDDISGDVIFQPGTAGTTEGSLIFNNAEGDPRLVFPGDSGPAVLYHGMNSPDGTTTLGSASGSNGFAWIVVSQIRDNTGTIVIRPHTQTLENDGGAVLDWSAISTIQIRSGTSLIAEDGSVSLGSATNGFGRIYANQYKQPGTETNAMLLNIRQLVASDGSTPAIDWATVGQMDLFQNKLLNIVIENGNTGSRPATPVVGQTYFDTSLAAGAGKPIWYNGTHWVDATGATV